VPLASFLVKAARSASSHSRACFPPVRTLKLEKPGWRPRSASAVR
jgi:hypothetical protein